MFLLQEVGNIQIVGTVTAQIRFNDGRKLNVEATIGAITLFAAEAIKNHYLKNPGPLVQV